MSGVIELFGGPAAQLDVVVTELSAGPAYLQAMPTGDGWAVTVVLTPVTAAGDWPEALTWAAQMIGQLLTLGPELAGWAAYTDERAGGWHLRARQVILPSLSFLNDVED